jgi:hypothetical protein
LLLLIDITELHDEKNLQMQIEDRLEFVLHVPDGVVACHIFFITLQGLPTATVFDGISFTTTEPAPIETLSPIDTPGNIVTLPPIHTLLPIVTDFAHSCRLLRSIGSVLWQAV